MKKAENTKWLMRLNKAEAELEALSELMDKGMYERFDNELGNLRYEKPSSYVSGLAMVEKLLRKAKKFATNESCPLTNVDEYAIMFNVR